MRLIAVFGSLALAACGQTPSDAPAEPEPPRFERVSSDPVEHGERLSKVLGCVGCHTPELT